MAYLLNIEREKLQELKVLAAKEGTTIKNILDEGIDEYLKKHLKSNNPQTELSQFDKESILAIPNLYRDAKTWDKFYSLVKSKKDYQELDKALNMINQIHNRKLKEF
jgi:response regulator of citrate/malate metabolism